MRTVFFFTRPFGFLKLVIFCKFKTQFLSGKEDLHRTIFVSPMRQAYDRPTTRLRLSCASEKKIMF